MASPAEILAPLGLDSLLTAEGFTPESGGTLRDAAGRVAGGPREFLRSLRFVLEKEAAGSWPAILKGTGRATGKSIAARLDAELARLGKPILTSLPLEACLALFERQLALHGWGRVELDLTDAAEHGLVLARVRHSCFAEAFSEIDGFVDPMLAGVLLGFLEHISGQSLGCEEIACACHGAPHCTFVITAPERLEPILPAIGRETAEVLVARLKT